MLKASTAMLKQSATSVGATTAFDTSPGVP
jgi:hypothetical protein